MQVESIMSFAKFLCSRPKTLNDVTKYLALHTFQKFQPLTIFIGLANPQGDMQVAGSFGIPEVELKEWKNFSIKLHLPVNISYRNSERISVHDQKAFIDEYPIMREMPESVNNWKSFHAWPLDGVGAICIFAEEEIHVDEIDYSIILAINSTLTLWILNSEYRHMVESNHAQKDVINLTSRQLKILNSLQLGKRNAEIARDMGYSESLIRQETVNIYRILKIGGRKDLGQL